MIKTLHIVMVLVLLVTPALLAKDDGDLVSSLSNAKGNSSLTRATHQITGDVSSLTRDSAINYEAKKAAALEAPKPREVNAKQGGDTCASAFMIASIPFTDSGTTVGYANDYEYACPYAATAPDVVYRYTPTANINVDVTLCVAITNYDTKLFVYAGDCTTTPIACNDDSCNSPAYSNPYQSQLNNIALTAGTSYYFVVDGYSSGSGAYQIDITSAIPLPTCPTGSLFSQPPMGPSGDWSAAISDTAAGYTCYDNFSGVTGAIKDIHFWGVNGIYSGGWYLCDKSVISFIVTFYNDDAGAPGTVAFGPYTVTGYAADTAFSYGGFPLKYFSLEIPSTTMASGWISIVGTGDDACWFLWMNDDTTGDGSAYQDTDVVPYDFSLCFTSTGLLGSCCNNNNGQCQDNIASANCLPPLRFTPGTTCANLVPACGLGSCCQAPNICTPNLTNIQCLSLGGTWHPGAVCDPNPCPCILSCPPGSIAEGETCGTRTNDGFNIQPPEFTNITSGQTFCGNAWAEDNTRDTDWYQFVLTQPATVTWDVQAAFDFLSGIVTSDPVSSVCDSLGQSFISNVVGLECDTEAVTVELMPGTYWAFFASYDFNGLPCSTGPHIYTGTLTITPITSGACCNPTSGACVVNSYAACVALYGEGHWLPNETCDPSPCPPINDTCATAIAVGTLPATKLFDNTGATTDTTITCSFTNGPYKNVWFTVVGTGNTITASVCSAGSDDLDTKIKVFCNTCESMVCVGGNDDDADCLVGSGYLSTYSWCSALGTTYYITVGGYNETYEYGVLELVVSDDGTACSTPPSCVPSKAAPPNDTCETASALTLPASVTVDTTEATSDIVTSCGFSTGPYLNVWYTVVGDGTTLTASTCNATIVDTKISVFCGGCSSRICVGGDDDACAGTNTYASIFTWCSELGSVYYITVGGYGTSDYGSITLDVTSDGVACSTAAPCTLPTNDTCTTAIAVGALPATVTGNNSAATDDISMPCGFTSGPYKNLWYTVVGNGQTLTASTCDAYSTFDSKISVFCYSCAELICVGGNDDDSTCTTSTLRSTYSWCSEAGTTYYITVGGYSASSIGNFMLTVTSDGLACSDPPYCAPCDITCPTGGIQENETCGAGTNDGCNMICPEFTVATVGSTYCGTVWADGSLRDTDWYQLTLTQMKVVTFTVNSEFASLIGLALNDPYASTDCDDHVGISPFSYGTVCRPETLTITLFPGTYWFVVAPNAFTGMPCTSGPYEYTATFTVSNPPPIPATSPAGIIALIAALSALFTAFRMKRH